MSLLESLSLEETIEEYRLFYKRHLAGIKHRDFVLNQLRGICEAFSKIEPRVTFLKDVERDKLESRINEFLRENFKEKLIDLYNRKVPAPKPQEKHFNSDKSIEPNIFVTLISSFESLNERHKQELNYKKSFINFVYSCLSNYGLHPDISKRNPSVEKKYNLVLKHFYRSKTERVELRLMMTYDVFDRDFASQFVMRRPIKIKGKLIPFDDISEVRITTTLLKEDEIPLFAEKNRFIWNETEKDEVSFIEHCLDETETYHPNPFDERTHDKGPTVLLIEEARQGLIAYPDSLRIFNSAIEKYEGGKFERNALDDMRLSLEILLRQLLGNTKSLENQMSELGAYQKSRGASNEVTNMFHKLIEYYTKYQNNYVKHNDMVQASEINFVVDLTSTFMKYLLMKS
ncbi:MAG: hypothetical protein RIF36_16380 [Imperialibacter sp.]|uniref:hypothetical protein n=1 Tax=Imperialibacter sp. TaxID=2038411 RepID=UPI0032EBC47C